MATKIILISAPAILLPLMVLWTIVTLPHNSPGMAEFRIAGLLMAAGYLLRTLLLLNVEAQNAPFLETVRRDVIFGFVTPAMAAAQVARRISGLPSDVHFKGRLDALTEEICAQACGMWRTTELIAKAAERFRNLPLSQQTMEEEPMANFLSPLPKLASAVALRRLIERRSSALVMLLPEKAKDTDAYLKWQTACEAFCDLGKDYVAARASLQTLLDTARSEKATKDGEQPGLGL